MLIGKFYITEINNEKKINKLKVEMHDTPYISIEEISLKKIFQDFISSLKHYLFTQNKFQSSEITDSIYGTAQEIYDPRNKELEENGEEPMDYNTYFKFSEEKPPSYIN